MRWSHVIFKRKVQKDKFGCVLPANSDPWHTNMVAELWGQESPYYRLTNLVTLIIQ